MAGQDGQLPTHANHAVHSTGQNNPSTARIRIGENRASICGATAV